jgi:hypothetical protein
MTPSAGAVTATVPFAAVGIAGRQPWTNDDSCEPGHAVLPIDGSFGFDIEAGIFQFRHARHRAKREQKQLWTAASNSSSRRIMSPWECMVASVSCLFIVIKSRLP